MKKVQVLMSTYNGEMFIREQIDSILNQDYSNIELLIRDDGSSDETINIIVDYAQKHSNIKYYQGVNLGACKSFFDLIDNADKSSDYFAFSDQDDYWLPNKISKAVEKLEKENKQNILLYASRAIIVNEKLELKQTNNGNKTIRPGFGNALIENICIGCSIVFNNTLFKILKDNLPKNVYMHDWWLYLVSSACGKIIYDNNSYLLYRQHSNNVIGMYDNFIKHWIKRMKNFKKMKKHRELQLFELNRLFVLDKNKSETVNKLLLSKRKLYPRINVVLTNLVYRQRYLDDLIFKLLLIIEGY